MDQESGDLALKICRDVLSNKRIDTYQDIKNMDHQLRIFVKK